MSINTSTAQPFDIQQFIAENATGPVYRCGPNLTLIYSPAQLRELAAYRRRRAWDLFTTEVAREIDVWFTVCYQRVQAGQRAIRRQQSCWQDRLDGGFLAAHLRLQRFLLIIQPPRPFDKL